MNGETYMEQQTPIVSIVIPVYNAERDLPECLDAIREQTFTQWEAILVDDGSPDGSARICDEAAKNDPRFRVIHKENGGVSTARNAGIEAAKGKYLMFIDADDLVVKTYVQKMVEAAETYGTDLVMCGFNRFGTDWTTDYRFSPFYISFSRRKEEFLMLYTETVTNMFGLSIWAKLFRTAIIRENGIRFDTTISYEEDCVFMADCYPYFNTFAAIGEPLYRYRQQEESLSKGYRKNTFHFLVNGYRRRCALLKENGLAPFLPKLKDSFFIAIKNTCQKIANAGLTRRERLEEYRAIVAFPEVRNAMNASIIDKVGGFMKLISRAIRRQNPGRLDRIMQIWRLADRAVAKKNIIMENHRKKANA